MKSLGELLKEIKSLNLYSRTGHDWVVSVEAIVTEPVCPTASIYPECGAEFIDFIGIGDTPEEAVENALTHLKRFLVSGDIEDHGLPFSLGH